MVNIATLRAVGTSSTQPQQIQVLPLISIEPQAQDDSSRLKPNKISEILNELNSQISLNDLRPVLLKFALSTESSSSFMYFGSEFTKDYNPCNYATSPVQYQIIIGSYAVLNFFNLIRVKNNIGNNTALDSLLKNSSNVLYTYGLKPLGSDLSSGKDSNSVSIIQMASSFKSMPANHIVLTLLVMAYMKANKITSLSDQDVGNIYNLIRTTKIPMSYYRVLSSGIFDSEPSEVVSFGDTTSLTSKLLHVSSAYEDDQYYVALSNYNSDSRNEYDNKYSKKSKVSSKNSIVTISTIGLSTFEDPDVLDNTHLNQSVDNSLSGSNSIHGIFSGIENQNVILEFYNLFKLFTLNKEYVGLKDELYSEGHLNGNFGCYTLYKCLYESYKVVASIFTVLSGYFYYLCNQNTVNFIHLFKEFDKTFVDSVGMFDPNNSVHIDMLSTLQYVMQKCFEVKDAMKNSKVTKDDDCVGFYYDYVNNISKLRFDNPNLEQDLQDLKSNFDSYIEFVVPDLKNNTLKSTGTKNSQLGTIDFTSQVKEEEIGDLSGLNDPLNL